MAIIAIIIAIGVGSWSYQTSIVENEIKDEIEDEIKDETLILLEGIKKETGISFSEIKEIEFGWFTQVDPELKEEIILGKGFEVKHIPDEQYDNIKQFFENNGFEIDTYNIADGLVSGLVGYRKEKMACTVESGVTGYKEAEGQWSPSEINTIDAIINCGELEKTEIEYATEDWQTYINEKYEYSFKYPINCLYGPLPGYCKQNPPEERSRECLCYLNAENSDEVSLGTFTGTKSDLIGASFSVSSYSTEAYNFPSDTDFVSWLREKFPYQDIEANSDIMLEGVSAVGFYTPQSPMAYSQKEIYFIRNNRLFKIYMINIDNEHNKELYNKILFTFSFTAEKINKEQACIDSGGVVTISSCCNSAEEYPNLCLVGVCGCSPDNSQETKVCDCGIDKCFDGNACIVPENE